jgi:molybdopterin-guanine dinucleotide biosynthesis protein A
MDHSKILGVVLAGGKSLRFGEDKSQVKLNNISLIDHILSEVLAEFKELLIVSNNPIEFKKSENISIIGDFKKNLGPLGGVLTAMKWIKDNNKNYQWISTFPTDTPFFKNQILKDFHGKINLKNGKLFFIKSNNTRHNIFGLWSIDLAE